MALTRIPLGFLALAALQSFGVPTAAIADEAADAAAKKLYLTRTCIACHGKDGRKAIQDYPDLAGQRADYLTAQIMDIVDGKRTGSTDASGNPRAKAMRGALIDPNGNPRITAEEAGQIANWLSAQEPRAADPAATPMAADRKAAAEKLFAGTCEACHGKDGRAPLEGFPVIAGQKRAYVVAQLKDIKEKMRTNGQAEAMQSAIAELKDEDLELLGEYISQLPNGKP